MTEKATEQESERPEFRGCVFCYAAEWMVHGVRTTVGAASADQSSQ